MAIRCPTFPLATTTQGTNTTFDPRSKHYGTGHHDHHHAAHLHAAQARGIAAIRGNRINRPQPDDPWQGNDFARELFQDQGANYFIGANHLVTVMAEAYAVAYTAAFFAPEILEALGYTTRGVLNKAGAFGPATNRIFWSGAASGGAAALRYGNQFAGYIGQTLEETPVGRVAVWGQSHLTQSDFTKDAWDWFSTGFAEGAQGTVMYFQGEGFYEGRVWLEIEWPILQRRSIDIIKVLNP